MIDGTSDEDRRIGLRLCLRKLSHDTGIWRPNLLDLLSNDLQPLQHAWSVDLSSVEYARRIISANLTAQVRNLTPRTSPERPIQDERLKKRYRHAVAVIFSIQAFTSPDDPPPSLEERHAWLAEGAPRPLRVSVSTAKRYFVDAVDQIVTNLLSAGYRPVVVDAPAPTPADPKPEADQAPQSVVPPEILASLNALVDIEQRLSTAAATVSPVTGPVRLRKGLLGSLGIPTDQSQMAEKVRVMAEIEEDLHSPALVALAQDDVALAIAALSGGTAAGAREVAHELRADYPSHVLTQAMPLALTCVGGRRGRRNAAAALKLLAANQSRAIRPGDFALVYGGICRLTSNPLLREALGQKYQEQSRAHGRIDLGGRWLPSSPVFTAAIKWADELYQDQLSFAETVGGRTAETVYRVLGKLKLEILQDWTLLDGLGLVEPKGLLHGHSHQVLPLVGDEEHPGTGVLERMLNSDAMTERTNAVVIVYEMYDAFADIGSINAGSASLYHDFLKRHSINSLRSDFADQLARLVGEPLTGEWLKTEVSKCAFDRRWRRERGEWQHAHGPR